MAKKDRKPTEPKKTVPPAETPRRPLLVLVLVGAAVAGWSSFLWRELLLSRRTGADPFCAFGGDCKALWDGAFASWVHAHSGLPVAGWGVVWGLVALALPLAALRADADGRWAAAARLVATAGLAGVVVLFVESLLARTFCSSCAVTHALGIVYFGVAWRGLPRPTPGAARRGLRLAPAALLGVFLALLYPGMATPKSSDASGAKALAAATRPPSAAPAAAPPTSPPPAAAPAAGQASAVSADERERRLEELVLGLQPDAKQALSNFVEAWRQAPVHEFGPPRALDGPTDAPVQVVEFTDTLCSHCASLHATLEQLRGLVPPGSFAVDSRHYPLDGNCNPGLEVRGPETVRCLAARARICLEGSPHADDYTVALYGHQATLGQGDVFALAEPYLPSRELSRCVGAADTAAKLRDDTAAAAQLDPHGTPIVVVNGKLGTAWAPFLYAMVLSGGDVTLPAFTWLPPPKPLEDAHAH